MIKIVLFSALCFLSLSAMSQGVTIGSNNPPDPSAVLDLQSTNGGLLLPRLSTAQRNALQNIPDALVIYNTDNQCVESYFPSGWKALQCDCNTAPPAPVLSNAGPFCAGADSVWLSIPLVQGATGYTWTIDNQDTLATGQGSDSILVHFSNTPGTRSISVTANNFCGTSSPSQATVQVVAPDSNFSITPNPVIVNNAASFSANQSGASYAWTFQNGSPASSVSQSPSVTWTQTGSVQVQLTVTDNNGCVSSLDSLVTVTNCQPGTWTFTTCGQTGRFGPSQAQCNSSYGPGVVSVVNGYQYWVVPASGSYQIEAWGASPPTQTHQTPYNYFGRGVKVRGTLSLMAGDTLILLVGQRPAQSNFNGGAGGTFVTTGTNLSNAQPLIIAGGGGSYRCGFSWPNYQSIIDASTSNSGKASNVPGGSNGNGGSCNGSGGASGAGFLGNGCGSGTPPLSFRNGGVGGFRSQSVNTEGGFGGGGQGEWGGSGGGGGYSGGGGGNNNPFPPAGGGGSFIDPAATNVATTDGQYNNSSNLNGPITNLNSWNTAAGQVVITRVCP